MEGSDVFTQGVEAGENDPFEGSDFGDFGEPSPDPAEAGAEVERPVPGPEHADPNLPIVDREGARVEGGAIEESVTAEVEQQPPAATPEPTPEPPQAPVEPPPAEPAEGEPEPPPQELVEAAADVGSGEDAPLPDEKKDGNDRVTHRRYVVLQVDGPGKFSQVDWHEDSKGKMVKRGTPGAKRQTVAVARGAEDALKIGYAAIGSPPQAHLVAIAAAYFQPKKIEPEPPQPERQRLRIS